MFKKAKKGFTLVELLIVIAVLAILAVVVSQSLLGTTDKANSGADASAVGEMSNAIERWTAEYELYTNDVQNGLTTGSQDAVKTRVESVLKVVGGTAAGASIATIDQTNTGFRTFTQKLFGINETTGAISSGEAELDSASKLPTTPAGAIAVLTYYTKTKGSASFAPKQKDMSFYYNIDTGTVIFAKTGITTATNASLLNAITGKYNSEGVALTGTNSRWIDLTSATTGKVLGTSISNAPAVAGAISK